MTDLLSQVDAIRDRLVATLTALDCYAIVKETPFSERYRLCQAARTRARSDALTIETRSRETARAVKELVDEINGTEAAKTRALARYGKAGYLDAMQADRRRLASQVQAISESILRQHHLKVREARRLRLGAPRTHESGTTRAHGLNRRLSL